MGWCCSPNWSSSGNYRCKRACLDVGGIFRSTPYVIKRPVKWLSTDRFPHVRLCLGLGRDWLSVSVNSNACVTRSDKISLATHTWVEQIVISRAGQKLTVSHFPARNAIEQVFWILVFWCRFEAVFKGRGFPKVKHCCFSCETAALIVYFMFKTTKYIFCRYCLPVLKPAILSVHFLAPYRSPKTSATDDTCTTKNASNHVVTT